MIDYRAAHRYARALLGYAEEKGTLEKTDADLNSVSVLLAAEPKIAHLALNPTLSQTEKEEFMEKIIPSGISKEVLRFVKLLVKKGRFRELAYIQRHFRLLFERKKGIQEVHALSAKPLSPELEAKLVKLLKSKLRSEIRLVTETDPELIGGLILRYDGMEVDTSYRSRLMLLKQKLAS